MAMSWNELNADHKLFLLVKPLGGDQGENAPIACRICEQVFFDFKVLFNHFRSHFNEDGTLKPGLSFVSPENETNSFSSSPHVTRSLSVPVNVGGLGTSTWQSGSPSRPNLSIAGNFVVPTLFKNSIRLRGPALTHRPQAYPSPTNFSSPTSHGELPLQPKQSLSPGISISRSTTTPIQSGISISPSVQASDFHLFMSPAASASPPILLSNFQPPISTAASTSHSVPGTSNPALGPTSSSVLRSARQNGGRVFGYTKPYILQLEQPIKKMKMSQNDEGDNNNNRGGMDLTLKL